MIRALVLALSFVSGSVHAAYANVAPPAGFSQAGGVNYYKAPANAPWIGGSAAASVTANVGGRAVVMPVSMRLASNAASFAIGAIRLTPQSLAVGAAASWLLPLGFRWLNDQWEHQDPGVIEYYKSDQDCYSTTLDVTYLASCPNWQGTNWEIVSITHSGNTSGWITSYTTRRIYSGEWYPAVGFTLYRCATGYVYNGVNGCTAGGAGTWIPATPEDWQAVPSNPPMPDDVPNMPPMPGMPVELPIINPSPGPDPVPMPLRVPVGDPVPIPATSPQRYRQPIVDIKPKPTVTEPWRVDFQPGYIEGEDPAGLPEPVAVGGSDPVPTPTPGEAPSQSLCEQHPEIAACKPLGEPDSPPALEVRDVSADFSDRITFGADTAACPAPRVMSTTLAGDLQFSWEGACMFADGIRPVVIALAYLAAAASFFGIGFARGD